MSEEYLPQIENIVKANIKLQTVVTRTPVMKSIGLSEEYDANIWFKREDLQIVRSYKLRGAYNKISNIPVEERSKGVICASAGNHAQGVAYSCNMLNIKGKIFMPATTPNQKVKMVKMFGKDNVEIVLAGDTFDASSKMAVAEAEQTGATIIPPFDDIEVIEGQATVGLETLEDLRVPVDYLFVPVGGGGLAAGVATYFKKLSPHTQIIGVEPEGAPSMQTAFNQGEVVELEDINKFVDGAAVQRVGDLTYKICKEVLDEMITVPEGKVCTTILKMYNEAAIVLEPAGALSVTALDFYKDKIKGKNVVCVLSGSNNDITRMEEIKERSMLYEGLKHYFIVRFPQRAGALREFVNDILGPNDDITHFEYNKKTHRLKGPALIGIVTKHPDDIQQVIKRLEERDIVFQYLNDQSDLFQYLV